MVLDAVEDNDSKLENLCATEQASTLVQCTRRNVELGAAERQPQSPLGNMTLACTPQMHPTERGGNQQNTVMYCTVKAVSGPLTYRGMLPSCLAARRKTCTREEPASNFTRCSWIAAPVRLESRGVASATVRSLG